MTRNAEEQARRYLRLFPLWMRADRGEEVVGLTLDQLAPGVTRLPLRSRLDLVRAGLHARRRGTPPPRVWNRLMYTTVFRNDPVVPAAWRAWLASVVMTPWITVAYALIRTLPFSVLAIMQFLMPVSEDRLLAVFYLLMWLGSAVGLWVARRQRWRSRVLLVNGFGPDGRPLPPNQIGRSWSRPSVPNTWAVPALVGFALVGGVYAPVAWFQADRVQGPGLLLSAASLAAVAWVLLVGRARLEQVEAGPPAPGAAAKDDRVRRVASAACGAGMGLVWSWVAAFAAAFAGLSLVATFAAPVAALAFIVLVRRTERRIGRRVGEWDLHPAWAPQLVERPVEHLPAPPGGPSTPALG